MLLDIKSTSEHDADIRYFINQGATQLFATGTRALMCKTVDIDCQKAEVDKDFLFFTFVNEDGKRCSCGNGVCACPTFYYFTSPENFQYLKNSGYTFGSARNLFTWNNGYLNLPSTISATKLTYYYLGLAEDCDGYMVLNSEYEIALSNYAAYKFVSTANKIAKYSPEFRRITWNTWLAQFNRLTSEKFAREFKQSKSQIRSMMANSLVYWRNYKALGISNK